MVTLNVDPANATVESVESRYDREWLQLQDDRKVRGYDLRSEERRSRDFVDPEVIDIDVTTETEYTLGGVDYVGTERVVTGTVGDQFDNNNGTNTSALIATLPDRGEDYA